MKRITLIGIIVLAIVNFVLFYPGEIPYSLSVIGKIYAHKEWIVSRNREDILTATLHNHAQGKPDSYFVTESERGDALNLNIHQSIVPGAYVAKGDTVGWIDSNILNFQLAQLRSELRTQKATLLFAKSGEKASVILEAERSIEHAREVLDEQRKIVIRLKKLYETDFTPYQDYEIALNLQNLYEINVEIADAQLKSYRPE